MIQMEERLTYKLIEAEYQETILWVEKWILGIWIFASIYFADIMIYDSHGLTYVQNFMLEQFNVIPTFWEVWLFWYFVSIIIAILVLTLFDLTLEIIYRIKPEWW